MSKQREQSDNPYRAPSSNLTDERNASAEWSDTFVDGAEKFIRCYLLGLSISLLFSIFAMVALDFYFQGWEDALFDDMEYALFLPIACFVLLALTVPISKIYVRRMKQKHTVQRFITSQRQALLKWYNRTISITLVVLIASAVLWLYFAILDDFLGFNLTSLQARSRALLALPVISPVVFVVVRATHRKARDIIDQMSSKMD